MRRGPIRAFVLLGAMALAGCGYRPSTAPMAGVNATGRDAYVRLVLVDGSVEEYRLPGGTVVRIATSGDVDRAVLFDGACLPMVVNDLGEGNNTFAYGGQFFVGPGSQAGYSSDVPSQIGPAAPRSEACANVPTPDG